jgi:hypothetical protein
MLPTSPKHPESANHLPCQNMASIANAVTPSRNDPWNGQSFVEKDAAIDRVAHQRHGTICPGAHMVYERLVTRSKACSQ